MVNIFYYKPHSYSVKISTCLQNDKDMKYNLYVVCILKYVHIFGEVEVADLAEKSSKSAACCKFGIGKKFI